MQIYKRYKDLSKAEPIDTDKALNQLSGYWQKAEQMLVEGSILFTPFAWYGIDREALDEI